MNLDGNAGANLTALSGAVPAALFAAFMPPVTDIWVTKPGTVTCAMVRDMEVVAGAISMGFAVVISGMVRSYVPVLVTGLVTAGIIGSYEYILRRDLLQ
jgi:hypothetical protein